MPELPEVETIAHKLRPDIVGQKITNVQVFWHRTVDRPGLDEFQARLIGAAIISVDRRGKFLILALDIGWQLLVHLRMSGHFEILTPGRNSNDVNFKHVRALFTFASGMQLAFINPRKFGRLYLVRDIDEVTGALGPEPLGMAFTPEWLCRALAGRQGEIKRLLLDQHFVAGLGNIYASECLWQARIHPQRPAGSLSGIECRRLHEAIVTVLAQAVAAGGSSLDDRQYRYPDGGTGTYQERLQVYDRDGESCPRCHYTLKRIVQGQRSTYFCPICQPITAGNQAHNIVAGNMEIEMETKTLMISGMSCQMCVKHVTHALQSISGVTDVKTDLASNTAVVTFDRAATGLPEFAEAVAEAGYEVTGMA